MQDGQCSQGLFVKLTIENSFQPQINKPRPTDDDVALLVGKRSRNLRDWFGKNLCIVTFWFGSQRAVAEGQGSNCQTE